MYFKSTENTKNTKLDLWKMRCYNEVLGEVRVPVVGRRGPHFVLVCRRCGCCAQPLWVLRAVVVDVVGGSCGWSLWVIVVHGIVKGSSRSSRSSRSCIVTGVDSLSRGQGGKWSSKSYSSRGYHRGRHRSRCGP